jgi:hypothetical protein
LAHHKEAEEDLYIEDADDNIRALGFPNNIENIREIEIGGLFRIGDPLTTLSSDELLDPPITQVPKNETNSKAKSDDEVIPSSHPLKASTSIQVPTTAPTSTRSSIHSRKPTRKAKSQHTRDIAIVEAKEERRK